MDQLLWMYSQGDATWGSLGSCWLCTSLNTMEGLLSIALWPPSRGRVRLVALDTSMLWSEAQSSGEIQS